MPLSKDFSHRLDILDACLRRAQRKWDADALLQEINSKLAEAWGKKISRRTLFEDLKYLQEEIAAPVEKYKEGGRVFYRYSEPDFSIKKLPLSAEDVGYLKDAMQILQQVSAFSITPEVAAIVRKLEHTAAGDVAAHDHIHFEQQATIEGAVYFDDLLQAIKEQLPLQILYQPFGVPEPMSWLIHPYLLKEYRNR